MYLYEEVFIRVEYVALVEDVESTARHGFWQCSTLVLELFAMEAALLFYLSERSC